MYTNLINHCKENEQELVERLYDYLICGHPLTIIYFIFAIVKMKESRVKEVYSEFPDESYKIIEEVFTLSVLTFSEDILEELIA